jgi:membrane-associated phospholipid phosphatase
VTACAKRSVAACLTCGLAVALLASLAFQSPWFRELDARALNKIAAQGGRGVAEALVVLGDPLPNLVLIGLVLVAAIAWRRPLYAGAAVVLIAGADLTTALLKPALAAYRFEPVLRWEQLGEAAFPSGHMTAVTAVALAFVLVSPPPYRRLSLAFAALLVVAVGWAVAALHWHAPSDVVGAVLVVLTWFFAIVAVLCERRARAISIPSRTAPGRCSAVFRRFGSGSGGRSAGLSKSAGSRLRKSLLRRVRE